MTAKERVERLFHDQPDSYIEAATEIAKVFAKHRIPVCDLSMVNVLVSGLLTVGENEDFKDGLFA